VTLSPCVRICKVDDSGTYCVSCFRTLQEIGTWQWMTEEEQARTIALTEIRKLAHEVDNETKGVSRKLEPCRGHDAQE
jgi:predicted Fe-S protein YdhL (DUF1289 family)